MRKIFLLILSCFCLLAQAGKINTARGEITLEALPERIAIIDRGILDTFIALNLSDKIVAVNSENQDLLPQKEALGTIDNLDLEKLKSLKIDLILITKEQAKYFRDLEQIAPTLDLSIKSNNFYSEGLNRLHDLGLLFDRDAEAHKIMRDLGLLKREIQGFIANKGRILSLKMNDKDELFLHGPTSSLNWLASELELFLLDDIRKSGKYGEALDFAYIKNKNPNYIFLTATPEQSASFISEAQKNSIAKEKIIVLNPENSLQNVGGPSALQNLMLELKSAFSEN